MSIEIIVPDEENSIQKLKIETLLLEPFSPKVLHFINDISEFLLKEDDYKQFPELISLAFWMRKTHIKKLHASFLKHNEDRILLGRGVVFHLPPSNVDTIFVYSWFISMLMGNSNILRISDQENLQTNILLSVIIKILNLEKHAELQKMVLFVKYGHDDEITRKLSSLADVRVIWGGDATVAHIRQIPIKPTAVELTFADKFSFSLINSKKILEDADINALIKNFYNDSFLFGQMACSSIKLIVWVGNQKEISAAKNIFWKGFSSYVSKNPPNEITAADITNKIMAECSIAIESDAKILHSDSPYINRIHIKRIRDIRENLHCGAGLFYEIDANSIATILPDITRKHQTVAYYGFSKDQLLSAIRECKPAGIDRIVPMGQALEFSPIWDGFDLFNSFCREISLLE